MAPLQHMSAAHGKTIRPRLVLLALVTGLCAGILETHADSTLPISNRRSVTVLRTFATPCVTFSNGTTQITIEGCDPSAQPGDISFPSCVVRLLLPPGHRLLRAEAAPTAAPVPLKRELPSVITRTSATQQRPKPGHVELISVQAASGCDIALLRVFPVGRGTTAEDLLFTPALRISAIVEPAPASKPALTPRDVERAAHEITQLVDNAEALDEYRSLWTRATSQSASNAPETRLDYLLITASRLLPAFEPLLRDKRRSGLAVKTETIEDIAATFPGRDLPERIRNCIRAAFTLNGVRSVLLGGDVAIVPCRYAFVPRQLPEPDCLVPADLYYACLDGSWNRDGNKHWGESTDGDDGGEVDLIAEVELGRAPVETEDEVRAFVTKTTRWSTAANPRTNGILLLSTALEQGQAQGGAMFDPLMHWLPADQTTWLDDRPGTEPRWTSSTVLSALNRSPNLVLYSGHGSAESLMRISGRDLAGLTNDAPFLIASVGCHAGEFDNPALSTDAIGEQLVTRQSSGAVAAVLNARAGWYAAHDEIRYSGEFQQQLVQRLLTPQGTTLGKAHQSAKQALAHRIEKSGAMPYRWCYYGLNLLGDPDLPVHFKSTCTPSLAKRAPH